MSDDINLEELFGLGMEYWNSVDLSYRVRKETSATTKEVFHPEVVLKSTKFKEGAYTICALSLHGRIMISKVSRVGTPESGLFGRDNINEALAIIKVFKKKVHFFRSTEQIVYFDEDGLEITI